MPNGTQETRATALQDDADATRNMNSYIAYLRLQEEAGRSEMTDEAYLQKLDEIMRGEVPEEDVSGRPPTDASRQTEVRTSIEASEEAPVKNGTASLLTPEQAAEMTPGMNGPAPGTPQGDALYENGTPPSQGTDQPSDGVDAPSDGTEPEDPEFEALKEAHPEIDWEKYGPEDILVLEVDGDGNVTGARYMDGRPADDYVGQNMDDLSADEGTIRDLEGQEDGLDAPEAHGTGLQADDTAEFVPEASGGHPDDQQQALEPEADTKSVEAGTGAALGRESQPGTETYTVAGHVDVHEEEFQTQDFLDEAAVGTGLAASIQTAEYIPPREVIVETGPAAGDAQPEKGQPVPGRSALAQRVIDIADEEKAAEAQGPGVNGPAGP